MFELSKVGLEHVPPRMIGNLRNVDEDLAQRVADGLGDALPKASPPARDADRHGAVAGAVDHRGTMKATLEGRKVGILFADGSDGGRDRQR